jgi:hypothetical protein
MEFIIPIPVAAFAPEVGRIPHILTVFPVAGSATADPSKQAITVTAICCLKDIRRIDGYIMHLREWTMTARGRDAIDYALTTGALFSGRRAAMREGPLEVHEDTIGTGPSRAWNAAAYRV